MAAGGGEHRQRKWRQRLLFVVEEKTLDRLCYTCLVFKMNLKDMFASKEDEDPDDWAVMRDFPSPVAHFETLPQRPERLDLAVVSSNGGTNIVAVSCDRRTIIYDTASANAEASPVPELRCAMPGGTALIPLGTQLYAIANELWQWPGKSQPSFQALAPAAQPSRHGRWSWRTLPAPPRGFYRRRSGTEHPFCIVTAFLAAGTRLWFSAPGRGTYSFDTVRSAWRKEGDWELPFERRGLIVPELGGLCFAICPHRLCLCAFDAPVTASSREPPAARYVWQDESYPHECQDKGFHVGSPGSLAYLGDGKFCITWTIAIEYAGEDRIPSRFALFLMAVQVVKRAQRSRSVGGRELSLVKHKVRCYKMSNCALDGYVLQPSLG